jgi:hypothetical protein
MLVICGSVRCNKDARATNVHAKITCIAKPDGKIEDDADDRRGDGGECSIERLVPISALMQGAQKDPDERRNERRPPE